MLIHAAWRTRYCVSVGWMKKGNVREAPMRTLLPAARLYVESYPAGDSRIHIVVKPACLRAAAVRCYIIQ